MKITLHNYPIFNFVLLGMLLWFGKYFIEWQNSYRIEAPSDEVLQVQYQDWARQHRVFPNAEQQQEIRHSELASRVSVAEALRRGLYLDDPIIYQRLLKNADFLGIEGDESQKISDALALDLHKSDELIRRRLVQSIELEGRATAYPLPEVDEGALRARYAEHLDRWKISPRIEFHHVYLSADNPNIQSKVASLQEILRSNSISDEQAYSLGDPFLLGNKMSLTELPRLKDTFGDDFAKALNEVAVAKKPAGNLASWVGPLGSAYGSHFVKIIAFKDKSYRDFNEVKFILQQEYVLELENKALKRYLEKLLDKYKFQ
ncbi:peptidylprolyl isomerase [Zhongshania aquimaris]|uniref:Peptidyl-prolyl cis-trans isomerase n=1 Tax=Zhongshania aquimaris TaxID=2857107 RepID=A0ABS6VSM7_9GAMM|nr:peptidylprolyl isomerase [Zhongshania aquimaris]MBW2941334.1 peptidyl-prolyl cis-trans isomerase [Zhongshania aquimaris]